MFKCQKDSFLQQFETVIVSAERLKTEKELESPYKTYGIPIPATNEIILEVILEDTILFPEGGGQPDDRGTINGVPVIRVIRRGKEAIHFVKFRRAAKDNEDEYYVPEAFKVGEKVYIELDWKRRFDHMQQHSGQHLITALADALFEFPTTSWWLGSEDSYIELDTPEITEEQIQIIEEKVNEKIRRNNQVNVEVVDLDDPSWKSVRARGLPEDVQNEIRIISIDGIDANVCCGTHVTNLSQLQMVKLLYCEKKKGKSLLHFLCGDRLLHRMTNMYQREQKLVKLLKSSAVDLVDAADKMGGAFKQSKKSCQILSKDLASLEANRFRTLDANGMSKNGVLFFYHREHVELDFGMTLLRELGETRETIILVILKTEDNLGHLLLRGGEDVITMDLLLQLGEEVCRLLDGKGTLRGNLYQAKISKVNGFSKALKTANKFVEDYVLPK